MPLPISLPHEELGERRLSSEGRREHASRERGDSRERRLATRVVDVGRREKGERRPSRRRV
jgi:hypothetical protein